MKFPPKTTRHRLEEQDNYLISLLETEKSTSSSTSCKSIKNSGEIKSASSQMVNRTTSQTMKQNDRAGLNSANGLNNLGNTCYFNSVLQVSVFSRTR